MVHFNMVAPIWTLDGIQHIAIELELVLDYRF
jgi:hypothetical protein